MTISDLPGHLPDETKVDHMLRDPDGYFAAAYERARREVEQELREERERDQAARKRRWWWLR